MHAQGNFECGINLTFIPLLRMLADGMHKFEASIPTWGNEGVYHRDQIFDCNRLVYFALLCRCSLINRRMVSTFFIFLSLKFLINHQDTLNVFVTCAHERMFRLIVMDEAHIRVQHGTRRHTCAQG